MKFQIIDNIDYKCTIIDINSNLLVILSIIYTINISKIYNYDIIDKSFYNFHPIILRKYYRLVIYSL